MPIVNGMGQSEHTALKHDHLAGILNIHMHICRGIHAKRGVDCWWYFDMNAGDGHGSPSIAWRVLHAAQPDYPWRFELVECNPSTATELTRTTAGWSHTHVHATHNRDVAYDMANDLRSRDYGIVFHDPNGGEIDLTMLRAFRHTSVDVLVYYSAAGNKRLVSAFDGQRGVRLGAIVAEDVKTHWLIRRPEGRHQWTLLIGTNWAKFPDWKRAGFYALHSPEGQEIYDRLHHTTRERQDRQPRLEGFNTPPYRTYAEYLQHPTFRAVRVQVLQRAGGMCEVCRAARASEVHHLRYPKWGTFDVPENLVAICHPCHCTAHGKTQ